MRENPENPCRNMPTRSCPDIYENGCGTRPCARFEMNDILPHEMSFPTKQDDCDCVGIWGEIGSQKLQGL